MRGVVGVTREDAELLFETWAPLPGSDTGTRARLLGSLVWTGDGTALAGDGTAFVGDGTALAGDGTALEGDGTALAGDGTALVTLSGKIKEETILNK